MTKKELLQQWKSWAESKCPTTQEEKEKNAHAVVGAVEFIIHLEDQGVLSDEEDDSDDINVLSDLN